MAIDHAVAQAPNASTPLLVVCLCAAWCHVCCDYQSSFARVKAAIQADHPQAQFVWLDIEDEAELLDPLEVDDFPTLLVAVGDSARFFGPLTPQPHTLERLVRSLAGDAAAKALPDPALHVVLGRILTTLP